MELFFFLGRLLPKEFGEDQPEFLDKNKLKTGDVTEW